MEIYERIAVIRKKLKLSRREFGEKIGVSESVIVNIEMNRLSRPDQKKPLYNLICSTFNVDPYWLKTGEGEMFLKKDDYDELMDFASEIETSRDLEWVKQLVLTIKRLTPEQRAEVARFVTGLAEMISQNPVSLEGNQEKEQD